MRIIKIIKILLKDDRGSIIPMIAVILILAILLGTVSFALTVMYRNRAVVRNALDSAVTSSLAAVTKEKKRYIQYGERLDTDEWIWVKCWEDEYIGDDEDGDPMYESVDRSYDAPRVQTWRNTEGGLKNYVQLDVGQADAVAQDYFSKNMEGNDLEVNIKLWEYKVTYDDKRIYKVTKHRTVVPIRPYFVPGRLPAGNCDPGVPDVYNEVENPDEWWISDFVGASTGSWSHQPGWTLQVSEFREIIFPRWVEVKARVEVELPVPFAGLLGRSTYIAKFNITSFKELVRAIP